MLGAVKAGDQWLVNRVFRWRQVGTAAMKSCRGEVALPPDLGFGCCSLPGKGARKQPWKHAFEASMI